MNSLRGIIAAVMVMTAGATALCSCGTGESAGQAREVQAADADKLQTKEFFAMDTYMSISAYGDGADAALDEAEEEIMRLDALLAAEHDDSEIARINREGGGKISEDTAYLVERAMEIHDETDGAFEMSVYPLKEIWGFTTQEYRVPSKDEIDETLQVVGTELIELDGAGQGANSEREVKNQSSVGQPAEAEAQTAHQVSFKKDGVKIDLGGIAKGYTSDRVAQIFEEHGVKGMINLGGNVQAVGSKPDGSKWRVAIRKPEALEEGAASWFDEDSAQAAAVAAQEFLGIVETNDQAVITSGGYERYFEQDGKIYHHILDSATGYPSASDLISTTVVSRDGTLADGLSTSVFVMGLPKAAEYWKSHSDSFDMIVMNRQGELYATEGLRDRFSSGLTIHWITKDSAPITVDAEE